MMRISITFGRVRVIIYVKITATNLNTLAVIFNYYMVSRFQRRSS